MAGVGAAVRPGGEEEGRGADAERPSESRWHPCTRTAGKYTAAGGLLSKHTHSRSHTHTAHTR